MSLSLALSGEDCRLRQEEGKEGYEGAWSPPPNDQPRSPAALLSHPPVSLLTPFFEFISISYHLGESGGIEREGGRERKGGREREREPIRESWKTLIIIRCFKILKSLPFFSQYICSHSLLVLFFDISVPFFSLFLFMNQGFFPFFS